MSAASSIDPSRKAMLQEAYLAAMKRFPLLVEDVQTRLSESDQSTGPLSNSTKVMLLKNMSPNIVLGPPLPGVDQRVRAMVGEGVKLLRIFESAAAFAYFLQEVGAIHIVQDKDWKPLVLLPSDESASMCDYLDHEHPSGWPWPLIGHELLNASTSKQLDCDIQLALSRLEQTIGQRLEAIYADALDTSTILAEGERPLRAMIIAPHMSAYQQFCARDTTEALIANGVEAEAYLVPQQKAWLYTMLEKVASDKPDVVFFFSKNRHTFKHLPRNLPIVAWDQDYVFSSQEGLSQNVGPRDRLFTLLTEWRDEIINHEVDAKQVYHLNLGSNTQVFTPTTNRPKPDYDILFVGNIHPFEKYKKFIGFEKISEDTQTLYLHARDRLFEWVRTRDENEPFILPDIESWLEYSANALNLKLSNDSQMRTDSINYFRYRIAHYVIRQSYVESLAEFRLGLFGNGWEDFPAVAQYAQPELENGEPLLDAMHRSAIHLQLHTWTVHHPRLYDTAAAAGFLLVGRVQEKYTLDNVFQEGEELDTFGSIAELKNKIRHYLNHPEAREAMAQRACARVQREHTMAQRTQIIMESLRHDPTK